MGFNCPLLIYYKRLILKNEFDFLSQLIENYHLSQVLKFLQAKKTIKNTNNTGIWHEGHNNYLKEYSKVINTPELIYGSKIFSHIILNEAFIDNVSNNNPYLFTPIICELNAKAVKNDEFVNRFLKVLTSNKNNNFFREIRNNQNLGEFNAYVIEEERPILFSLFSDIKVSSINQAWRGIGEQAILEMYEEAKKQYSPLRESDREQQNDTIWSYRIKNAIWYFDIMVRQAIKQKVNDHMWMFYYIHFADAILSNMINVNPPSEENRNSRNFDLITEIFTNMMDWKGVMINTKNNILSKSIYDCLGQCLYKVATSSQLKKEDKLYLFNWVWEDLIMTIGEDDEQNKIVDKITYSGFKMFSRPSMLFSPKAGYRDNERSAYIELINEMWTNRDAPKFSGEYEELADRFKKEVIDELNK